MGVMVDGHFTLVVFAGAAGIHDERICGLGAGSSVIDADEA